MNYLGLMSGTSADGIDAVLVSLAASGSVTLLASSHTTYATPLRDAIITMRKMDGPSTIAAATVRRLGELDTAIGEAFAAAANALLTQTRIAATDVRAIGSHGQTVSHYPEGDHPFSFQLGNAAVIAERTGITTIADFRARDIAAGGQGAPLVPAFHEFAFRSDKAARAVMNIGGIANVTFLPDDRTLPVVGFDTGPGNTLLDTWIAHQLGKTHDENGKWAATGSVNHELLERLLSDPFFKTAPPKSTGQERFNLNWIEEGLGQLRHVPKPEDVQATLVALTVESISSAIDQFSPSPREIYLCGGGVHNKNLVEQLRERLTGRPVKLTSELGIDPDWVEATAFAWLAYRTIEGQPGNLPTVTGALHPAILGAIYKV